ncbi:MAG TPA: bifunctional precorrin-2 dehydrogenase/sirohydrochlorin ferrochelatase [Myxococcales bacterium]|nr:bifunctional precorrin-2 dehydrogenase/sirohydrochlorin ferrochelatase [Myxococcales bacterium]
MRGLMIYQILEGQIAAVIGAGDVGGRRISQLKKAGAQVRVVDPNVDVLPEADELITQNYQIAHLEGVGIVFAATDNTVVNHQIATDARSLGLPVNVADDPDYCDFFMPAILKRGQLTLAISTGGSCPGFASLAKRHLDRQWGTEWELALEIVASARHWARERQLPWTKLLNDELLTACANNDKTAVESHLANVLGATASLEAIGIHWS